MPIHAIIYEWFDYILKGAARPGFLKDKINYQPMGSNDWKHASSLQAVASDTLRLYLDNREGGLLTQVMPKKPGYSSMEIDFKKRTERHSYYYVNNVIYDSLFSGGGLMFKSEPLKESILPLACFGSAMSYVNKVFLFHPVESGLDGNVMIWRITGDMDI